MGTGTFNPTSFTHVEWVDGKVHETGFTAVFAPNTHVTYSTGGVDYDVDVVLGTETNVGDTYAAVTSRSYHDGGVNGRCSWTGQCGSSPARSTWPPGGHSAPDPAERFPATSNPDLIDG